VFAVALADDLVQAADRIGEQDRAEAAKMLRARAADHERLSDELQQAAVLQAKQARHFRELASAVERGGQP
jgi:hypothetical protein